MRRAAIFVMLFLLIAGGAGAFEWASVAKKVQKSLVSLSTSQGVIYCSGFVIDDKRDFVMTAAHCVEAQQVLTYGLVVDRKNAWVVWQDDEADLAVLHAPANNRPELKMGKHPVPGQDVAAFGYGYGLKGLGMFRSGEVSGTDIEFPDEPEMVGLWVLYNFSFVGGMSGGPVTDVYGRMVGIVQRGNNAIGLGRSVRDIYSATKDFWAE